MELDTVATLVEDNVELFRLFWPPDPLLVQSRPGLCLVVMKRSSAGGGMLVAVPSALIPAGTLPVDPSEDDVVGPHCHMEIAGVRMTSSDMEPTGTDISLFVVDLHAEALRALTPLALVPETEDQGLIGFGEDLDIIPDPAVLVEMTRDWITGHASQRAAFYSAEEGEAQQEGGATAAPLPPRDRGITPDPSPVHQKPKEAGKKRVTTAALSEQLNSLMELIPSMVDQISDLKKGQQELQTAVEQRQEVPPVRPTQLPISQAVQGAANFAKMMGHPPRTKVLEPAVIPRPTITSGLDGNVKPQEQAEEMSPLASADPFVRAMLEQSKALMTLVSHMQQAGDPLLDGQGSSSSGSLGTRGSVGREKLQKELAMKSGNFYLAVLQNAAKRLKPASPKPNSVEEVASTDFSMIQYLERFGGYGQFKELGLIQYALAHICDALVHSDLNGARDYLALLMVGVDQANLDGNRWELAYRMMLLEEPPSQLWSYRNQSFDPRAKSFSSLAPQQWTTVALAYSKEMDYIRTKRQELTHQKPGAQQSPNPSQTNPKRKGRFPKAKAAQPNTDTGQS